MSLREEAQKGRLEGLVALRDVLSPHRLPDRAQVCTSGIAPVGDDVSGYLAASPSPAHSGRCTPRLIGSMWRGLAFHPHPGTSQYPLLIP